MTASLTAPDTAPDTTADNAAPNPVEFPIQGVIFDMDGVLTDTIEYHYQTWQQLFDEEGIPFDWAMNEKLRGLSRRDSLLTVLGDRTLPEAKMEELLQRKNQYFREFISQMTAEALLPGVGRFLDELKTAGLKLAVASASQNVYVISERLGIAELFDTIANVYDVPRPKPAPDVFLYAAAQIGVEPSACLVVEDGESGIEAALAAGMRVLGLGPVDRVGAATIVRSCLTDVTWANLYSELATLQPPTPAAHPIQN